jgi:ribosomal protein S18 acetylase RimI-like enzyme
MATMRAFETDDDYWRIRQFLREVFLLNGRRERSWQAYRFDYARWHAYENIEEIRLQDAVFLWETADGRIAAILLPESRGDAFLHVHPGLRTPELEQDMLSVAERHLATVDSHGRRQIRVWVGEDDTLRRDLVARRGYVRSDWPEYQRRRPIGELAPVPDVTLPSGYSIRSLGDGAELLERCYASGLVFHPDDIRYAVENRADPSWYRNIQNAPLYRRDLDLVAVAPDGAVASFCTIWFDDVTRTGAFEPVGTAPAHQRRGLGRAVMCVGLRRLERIGATLATVGSYSAEAGALYAAVGFTDYDLSEPWVRLD